MARHDPHSYTDFAQGRLRHIAFAFDVDFTRRQVRGSATYHLEAPCRGPLDLDTSNLEIRSVSAAGRPAAYSLAPAEPILGSRLRLELAGADEFTIEFVAPEDARALQWLTPAQTAGGAYPYLFTQCQPTLARTIFPCQDSPSVRFTYDAELRVPQPLFGAMTGAPLGGAADGDATRFRFRMAQPIPSYLFAVAVGEIVSRDLGPRTRVYAEPALIDAAAWEFGQIEDMVVEAERLYGPYPWERYDMLVLPPSFPYGGMENARLTFLTPTMIVGDRSLTNLLAHELAHSWTGNLVTNATWEDFWLNEGWTTYAERRILEEIEGEPSAMLRAAVGRNTLYLDLNRFGWTAAATRLHTPLKGIDPESVASYIPYEKGYAFLVALERLVGRETFDAFTRKYIAKYRFATITTEAFLEFLRGELPQVIGHVDLEAWIFAPGYPSDAPAFESPLIDEVSARLFDYQEGRLPAPEDVAAWRTGQRQLFLQHLPRRIPVDDCRVVEAIFGLDRTRVPQLLSHFFEIGIRSGYRECLPRAEAFLTTVGRYVMTRPVFQALAQTEWSRARARPLFEQIRDRHHPISVHQMEQVLAREGL